MNKARPILFSAPMVTAQLERRKTQTRRIAKLHKSLPNGQGFDCIKNRLTGCYVPIVDGIPQWKPAGGDPYQPYPHIDQCCPYGSPGDRLWVRETWSPEGIGPGGWGNWKTGETCKAHYRADFKGDETGTAKQWKPSIHMPRWASRITLTIVNVRLQRLQDISEQDAIAEGVQPSPAWFMWTVFTDNSGTRPGATYSRGGAEPVIGEIDALGNPVLAYRRDQMSPAISAKDNFAKLWKSINGSGSWDANPFVWAIEFQTKGAQA